MRERGREKEKERAVEKRVKKLQIGKKTLFFVKVEQS